MSYWTDRSHIPISKPIPGEELLYPSSPLGRPSVIIFPQSTGTAWRRGGHLHRVSILTGSENRQEILRRQPTMPTLEGLYKEALPVLR